MMALSQFVIRNRHSNIWYARIIIPIGLRECFSGKREIRQTLKTSDKNLAKRRSLAFWVKYQSGFEKLLNNHYLNKSFESNQQFFEWLSYSDLTQQNNTVMAYIKTTDILGREHVIDMGGDAKAEIEHAKWIHGNGEKLLEEYKDDPKTLEALLKIHNKHYENKISAPSVNSKSNSIPETPTPFNEAVNLYTAKLRAVGRKGKTGTKND